MSTTKRLTAENIDLDDVTERDALFEQVIVVGMTKVRADVEKLQSQKLITSDGILTPGELPTDMREGSPRDFGA